MTRDQLLAFRDRVASAFKARQIRAPIHLPSDDQAGHLLRIFHDFRPGDWLFSGWRSMWHCLLAGMPEEELFQMILEGRSMYICSAKHRILCSSIVGGILPIAAGTALGIKLNGGSERCWVLIGDMTGTTGVCHEFKQFVRGNALPVRLICESNGLSTDTPTQAAWGARPGSCRSMSTSTKGQRRMLALANGSPSSIDSNMPDEPLSTAQLCNLAMRQLASNPKTLFVGQSVAYPGWAYDSLDGVPMEQRIEMPVAKDFQMGLCTGLALQGYLPVSIYPRFDFLLLAMSQLVLHLDKLHEMSRGDFNPKVIIRTRVGPRSPLNAGPQHTGDHTPAFRRLFSNVLVYRINESKEIVPVYDLVMAGARPCIVVEAL